ncbi:TetR/AcrR family transcriptional regulator [Streptomyces sioyaensis]|uniref:TetR/AcrR family transcriptional regulator n=1 Tax=Streptomyces sioyaensis TaxID=67364 RepID=UPI0037D24C00
MEEIAESAGFSIGALYSNFGGKEALFLALMAERGLGRVAEATHARERHGADTGETAAELGCLLVHTADKDTDFAPLQAEFWLYGVRNPRVLDTMATALREPHQALEGLIGSWLAERGAPPEVSAASVVAALSQGLVRQRRIDPDSVPEELFGQALIWLFTGIGRGASATDQD